MSRTQTAQVVLNGFEPGRVFCPLNDAVETDGAGWRPFSHCSKGSSHTRADVVDSRQHADNLLPPSLFTNRPGTVLLSSALARGGQVSTTGTDLSHAPVSKHPRRHRKHAHLRCSVRPSAVSSVRRQAALRACSRSDRTTIQAEYYKGTQRLVSVC